MSDRDRGRAPKRGFANDNNSEHTPPHQRRRHVIKN